MENKRKHGKRKKVLLSPDDLKFLETFASTGRHAAREIKRANILLLLSKEMFEADIIKALSTSHGAIWRTREKYLQGGVEAALLDKSRCGAPPKYDEKIAASLVALACSKPPEGRRKWTLELLKEEMRTQDDCETMGATTIRLMLKKTTSSPGKGRCGASRR